MKNGFKARIIDILGILSLILSIGLSSYPFFEVLSIENRELRKEGIRKEADRYLDSLNIDSFSDSQKLEVEKIAKKIVIESSVNRSAIYHLCIFQFGLFFLLISFNLFLYKKLLVGCKISHGVTREITGDMPQK